MAKRNIGVAIGLPARVADELQGWREKLGDPSANRIVPHVTLLPPTRVLPGRLVAVEEHLRAVAETSHPFDIRLRGTATFRPVTPVVFVPLVEGIAECELLAARVRSGPLARELDYPYHPHVTVAQDLGEDALDEAYEGLSGFVARFPVGRFALFSRDDEGCWTWRTEFPLGGAEAALDG